MRTATREIDRAQRDLERDRLELDRKEKELVRVGKCCGKDFISINDEMQIAEIKVLANKRQNEAARSLARQLVKLREQKARSTMASARLTGTKMTAQVSRFCGSTEAVFLNLALVH